MAGQRHWDMTEIINVSVRAVGELFSGALRFLVVIITIMNNESTLIILGLMLSLKILVFLTQIKICLGGISSVSAAELGRPHQDHYLR